MDENITLCGDNCLYCPRFLAKTEQELEAVAKLWYRAGFRDQIVSADEIKCGGCSSHKSCTYHLVECIREHNVERCRQCYEFPCKKITDMLKRSREHRERCRQVCTEAEFDLLEKAFFEKENNL